MPKLALTVEFKENFACFMSLAFAIHSSIEITYHEYAVSFHCMLFGRVAEKKRIFTEGLIPLCFAYMITQYFLVAFGIYLLYQRKKYPKFNWLVSFHLFLDLCVKCYFSLAASRYVHVHNHVMEKSRNGENRRSLDYS